MNYRYSLLLPAMLVVLLFVGSASAICPAIPSPPYVPKSPEEDIVKVEAYIEEALPAPASPSSSLAVVSGPTLVVTVTFAAATPPSGQTINMLVTELQGNPATETVVGCYGYAGPGSGTAYKLPPLPVSGVGASIAVYAWLSETGPGTDRAPNSGSYPITSLIMEAPNVFYDPEPAPVGGIVTPVNKLEILTPYLAIAGLVAVVSAVVVVKRRNKD